MHATSRAPSAGTAPTEPAFNGNGQHQRLREIQRVRILTAMIETACEHGAGNVTVAQVVANAGISRRTFYEIFQDSEDCLLAALDDAVTRTAKHVLYAYEEPARWREKMRSALIALLELFDEDPHLGRFMIVETLAAGPRALQRREEVLTKIVAAVQGGCLDARSGAPGPLTGEAVTGAVFSVIHSHFLQPEPGRLIELVNPLMSTIVLPYLGPAAARRELQQPVVPTTKRPPKAPESPLAHLDIRLTYRTVRALVAVSEQPCSSNRVIANAAGIADQGQISKLLTRLEGLGLIENVGGGSRRGEPNSWKLTAAGEGMHNAIASQATA